MPSKVNFVNIASLGFLMASLAALVTITANPNIVQIFAPKAASCVSDCAGDQACIKSCSAPAPANNPPAKNGNNNSGNGSECTGDKHLCKCDAGSGCVGPTITCEKYCGGAANIVGNNNNSKSSATGGYDYNTVIRPGADPNTVGYVEANGDVSGYYLSNGKYYAIAGTGNDPANYSSLNSAGKVVASGNSSDTAINTTSSTTPYESCIQNCATSSNSASCMAGCTTNSAPSTSTTTSTSTTLFKTPNITECKDSASAAQNYSFSNGVCSLSPKPTPVPVPKSTAFTTPQTTNYVNPNTLLSNADACTSVGWNWDSIKRTCTYPFQNITANAQGVVTVKASLGGHCNYSSDCGSGLFCGRGATCQKTAGSTATQTSTTPAPVNNYAICNGDNTCNTNLTNLQTVASNLTYGLSNNYINTYQNINAANPTISNNLFDPTYYKKAFDPQGQTASTALGVDIAFGSPGEAVFNFRDVISTQTQYALSGSSNLYLVGPGANKLVYIKNDTVYDAATNSILGPQSQFAGYKFVQAPTTVYTPQASVSESNNTSPYSPIVAGGNKLDYLAFQQHTTITQSTFFDPTIQKINQEIGIIPPKVSYVGGQQTYSLSPYQLSLITKSINNNLTYSQSVSNATTPLSNNTAVLGVDTQFRTLDNLIKNDSTVCFDFAITEQLELSSKGVQSTLVQNYALHHTYLIVNSNGTDYVVDPTTNIVEPASQYMTDKNFTLADTTVLNSPLQTLPNPNP